ncbi:Hsp20/alpha crystallin family protein [candidate division KSB1 bacterium]|nr:Hsp20/alpha crystallin family protein [candidate division KSB1 bacterium]
MPIRDLIPSWRNRKEVAVRREEPNPFFRLQQEVNSLFDSFFSDFDRVPAQLDSEVFTPCTDIRETDKEYIVECELPGLDEKDIELGVTSDGLTLRGEKKTEREEKRGEYHCIERSSGRFERYLPLPADVDSSKIAANFKNGVLQIKLPKQSGVQSSIKRIPILNK